MTGSSRNALERTMLERLARQGPQSRADLARGVGVTRATAGNLATRLLDEGIVIVTAEPHGEKGRPVGRPGELIALNPDHTHVIGVDAGIDFVLALRLDLAGTVRMVKRVELATAEPTPQAVAHLVGELVPQLAQGAPAIAGISIAIPGIITREGHVMRAPFLGWSDVPFRALVAQRLRHYGALKLENDANALAMGALIRGHVSAQNTNIFFSMDVGVGGGIIWHGRLMDGQNGLAGEFGHIFVHPSAGGDAVRLEHVVGRRGVLARYAALGGGAGDLERFLAALDAGDSIAKHVEREWVDVMAQALSTLTSVLNPGTIVFGGSMTALLTRAVDDLRTAFQARLMRGTAEPQLIIAASAEHSIARGCADLQRAEVFRTEAKPSH